MKTYSIIFPAEAEYGEVVDSVADLLEAGIILEEELGDGFQWQDIFAALQVQPKIQEVVNDFPVFMEQFVKLNGETGKASVIAARNRILSQGKKFGKVTTVLIRGLYVLAENYSFVLESYEKGQKQHLLWQTLIGGGSVFPDGEV